MSLAPNLILESLRAAGDDGCTGSELATVAGPYWAREITRLRKRGYLIGESPVNVFTLDYEPEDDGDGVSGVGQSLSGLEPDRSPAVVPGEGSFPPVAEGLPSTRHVEQRLFEPPPVTGKPHHKEAA